jgi:hypothetical protein
VEKVLQAGSSLRHWPPGTNSLTVRAVFFSRRLQLLTQAPGPRFLLPVPYSLLSRSLAPLLPCSLAPLLPRSLAPLLPRSLAPLLPAFPPLSPCFLFPVPYRLFLSPAHPRSDHTTKDHHKPTNRDLASSAAIQPDSGASHFPRTHLPCPTAIFASLLARTGRCLREVPRWPDGMTRERPWTSILHS